MLPTKDFALLYRLLTPAALVALAVSFGCSDKQDDNHREQSAGAGEASPAAADALGKTPAPAGTDGDRRDQGAGNASPAAGGDSPGNPATGSSTATDASASPTPAPAQTTGRFACDDAWLTANGATYSLTASDHWTHKHLQACVDWASAAHGTTILLPVASRWVLGAPVNINKSNVTLQTDDQNGQTNVYCYSDYTDKDPSADQTGKAAYVLQPTTNTLVTADPYATNDATFTNWPSSYELTKGPVRLRNQVCATLIAARSLMMCGGETDVTKPSCQQVGKNASFNSVAAAGYANLTGAGPNNANPPPLDTKLDVALINIRGTQDAAHNVTPISNVKLRRLIIDGNAYYRQKTWSDAFSDNPVTVDYGPCLMYSERGCSNLWMQFCDQCALDGVVTYNTPAPSLRQEIAAKTAGGSPTYRYVGTAYNIFIEDSLGIQLSNNLAYRSGSQWPTLTGPDYDTLVTLTSPARASEAFTLSTTYRDVDDMLIYNNYVIDSTDGSLGFSATNAKSMVGSHNDQKGVYGNYLWQWQFQNSGGVMAVEAGQQPGAGGTGFYGNAAGKYLEFYNNTIDCNKGQQSFHRADNSVTPAKLCFYGLMLGNYQHQAVDGNLALHQWAGGSFHGNHVLNARVAYTVNAALLTDLTGNIIPAPVVWGNEAFFASLPFNAYLTTLTTDASLVTSKAANDPEHVLQDDPGPVTASGGTAEVVEYANGSLPASWNQTPLFDCLAGCAGVPAP